MKASEIISKVLLSPIALIYGTGLSIRKLLYKTGLLNSVEFSVPVISVGNLSMGGAGKTPHIEFLVRYFKQYLKVATLSRGYKRKSKGFRLIRYTDPVALSGDEPLQFKRKFPDVLVAVGEERTLAIPKIIMVQPTTQLILLDDAFQHLAVKPGLNILLTQYNKPFTRDFLLPSGRLREARSGYKRADLMIVTKCPKTISLEEKEQLIKELKPLPHQQLFFSYYEYLPIYNLFNPQQRYRLHDELEVLLICAIANTDYLMDYLADEVYGVTGMEFLDHHFFTDADMDKLKVLFDQIDNPGKLVLTTEKDAVRLEAFRPFFQQHNIPVFVLPIEVRFHFNEEEAFLEAVKAFMLDFKV
ncbi:MAG: tetraacyldisaccharide 4'-kinase [Bacteroidota bacterium]